jgi:hypothetical protein
MTPSDPADERLRAAFRSLAEAGHRDCADAERIWDAVSGRLPAAERRALVEKLSRDPECAEVWRLASELWREVEATESPRPQPHPVRWRWTWPALAAAAALLAVVVFGPALRRGATPSPPVHRDVGAPQLTSRVPEGASLPRGRFRLAWEPLATDARYTVRVTTDDLALAYVVADLRSGEYVVPEAVLARIPAGARVLWTVEARRADGTIVSSGTFTVRLLD